MSDSTRIHQLPVATETKSTESGTPQKVLRSLKPGEIGPARMNPVYEERAAANAQIERTLKAWRSANGAAGEASVPKGSGSPLSAAVRTKMEPKLGASLGSVRVHTGADSASAAKGFGARAFTVGEDVHFNSGEFNPGTKEGDKLLAHELTHVVQGQRSGIQRKADDEKKGGEAGAKGAEVSDPNEPAEKEADAVAEKVAGDEHGDQKKGAKKDKKGKDGEGEDKAEAAEGEGKDKKDEAKQGEESAKAEEKPAAISAKLEGVGTKLYRYAGEADAYRDEQERLFNEEKKRVLPLAASATTPEAIEALLGGLSAPFANNQSVAGMMIGKLKTAMADAQTAWAAEDAAAALEGKPAQAPKKKQDFIDSRLALLAAQAPGAIVKKINAATPEKIVDVKDVFWGICAANWDLCAPEEEASSELLNQIDGCYKAFDAEDIYKKMDEKLKEKWEAQGGFTKWLEGVEAGKPLPIAPPGMAADPAVKPYVDASKPAYPGTVSGFISTAKALDDPKIQAADKAGVLDLLKLQKGRYKSKMILAKMGAAGAGAARSATPAAGAKQPKLGKPSMFYLICFPENVYDAKNREHGSTGGGEPELQTTDMPAQAFMDGLPLVKS